MLRGLERGQHLRIAILVVFATFIISICLFYIMMRTFGPLHLAAVNYREVAQ